MQGIYYPVSARLVNNTTKTFIWNQSDETVVIMLAGVKRFQLNLLVAVIELRSRSQDL